MGKKHKLDKADDCKAQMNEKAHESMDGRR